MECKRARPKWLPEADDDVCRALNKSASELRPSWLNELTPEPAVSSSGPSPSNKAETILDLLVPLSCPNFAGCWVLHRVEGDMDALLKELRLPWVARKAAAAAGYGVGKAKKRIAQTRMHMEVENITPLKSFTRRYATDGVERDEVLEGRSLKVSARWEGDVLILESRDANSDMRFPKLLRYLQGHELVMEQTLPCGASVKQFFSKEEDEEAVEKHLPPVASRSVF
jgi:hypothetical protein